MKKVLTNRVLSAVLSLLIASCCLCSCAKDGESASSTASEDTQTTVVTLEEMCPPTYTKELPVKTETDYNAIDKSGFTEIDSDDAMVEGLATDKIYRDGNGREYFVLTDGTVAVTFLEDGDAYSAFYLDNGKLKYIGNSETSWYFKEDGTIDMVRYTYVNPKGSEIISYYEPDGTRIAISAAGTYYDDNFDELSGEQQIEFSKRLGDTQESQDTADATDETDETNATDVTEETTARQN